MDDMEVTTLEFERPIVDLEAQIANLRSAGAQGGADVSREVAALEEKCRVLRAEVYGSLTPWQRVQLARHPRRPYLLDYVGGIFTDFMELHGDRAFGDDHSLVAGIAMLDGAPVVVLGQQKGRNLHDNIGRNFAMAHPEGYRKAMRVMRFAERFNRPIITFIDTPGAYPGIAAEERGQAEAIARNLRDMASLRVPVVSVIIGEGGSGGALGIGVANRVLMMENAYYSVISPEGCAAILFRDAAKAQDAARALKITADDLLRSGVIDEIVREPLGGAHRDPKAAADAVKEAVMRNLAALSKLSPDQLEDDRYRKFRAMGMFTDEQPAAPAAKPARARKKTKK